MRNGANIFDLYRQVQSKESEILERTLTDAEKEKLKKLEKEVPMKDFKDRYGKEGESVYYATLTKMAKDEGFASDAQRRAAFAQGYKAKGKKGKKEETELDEKFTKKDFDKNEDENRHTENAIELVKMFGTSAEDIKVNAIAARHNMKGSIDRKDQQDRDALIKKYYPKLKEETELDESTGKYSKMNLDKAKKLMAPSKNRKEGIMMVMKGLGTTYKHATQLVDKILGVNPKTGRIESAELDEKYDLYHSTFSGAMQHAYDYAKSKLGVTVDPKEIDSKVATGPRKPTQGKTNTYRLKGKGGNLQIQVFNKGGSKPFELNMYKEEVELDEAMKYNFMVLDPDGKVMGMTSSEKNANDMAKPTGNLLKLRGRVVKLRRPMATTRGDRMIGMLPADNLGEGTDPIKEMIESGNFTRTEIKNMIKRRILDEAKFQVNYSKGGKLFSKTINAKDEDDAEEKAIKQFKIDDDDIRSVVKESLDETVLDTVLSISKGGSRYKDQEKDKDGKFIVKDRLGKVITSLSPSGAKKFLDSLKDPISGKGSVDALKKDRERRASRDSGGMGVRTRGAPEKNIVDLLRKFKEEVELDEVIPKSTMYALVKDGKVIAKGSKRDMTSKKKKEGGTVYNAPSKKVGDTIKEGYESEVLDVLSNADIDGYFKNNKLYISRRDASDAKKALEDADNITKLPKMVMEALDKEDEPKVKQIVKKLKKASQAHAGQATDLEKAISEDGHTDVASAIRQCKTVLEDSMQMLQKLKSMSPEDSLPSWWTNKLAVASNNMNKMRDYLLVPSMSEKTDKNNK